MDDVYLMDVVNFGKCLLFDDSSDDENGVLEEKIWDFAEVTVPRFNDKQFKQHFRISPSTFESLLRKLHDLEDNLIHCGHPELTLEKQLIITIWYLANIESFRQVGVKFGITKSSSWDVVYRICKKILKLNQQIGLIQWPTTVRAREIIQGFHEITQFPGVIGAIDGCHIEILKPRNHPNSYINRKGFASILLQGVCDDRKLFIDVFAGAPGSVHDARLYQMSDLSERIRNNLVTFPDDSHLIGDLAYVLSENLIVGFKDYGNLNNMQKNFNVKLSKTRVVIENAFAWLKGRFRRLKLLETIREDLIVLIIMASCILHNVCILENDLPDDLLDIPFVNNDFVYNENNEGGADNANARAKRLNIMYQLQANI